MPDRVFTSQVSLFRSYAGWMDRATGPASHLFASSDYTTLPCSVPRRQKHRRQVELFYSLQSTFNSPGSPRFVRHKNLSWRHIHQLTNSSHLISYARGLLYSCCNSRNSISRPRWTKFLFQLLFGPRTGSAPIMANETTTIYRPSSSFGASGGGRRRWRRSWSVSIKSNSRNHEQIYHRIFI